MLSDSVEDSKDFSCNATIKKIATNKQTILKFFRSSINISIPNKVKDRHHFFSNAFHLLPTSIIDQNLRDP